MVCVHTHTDILKINTKFKQIKVNHEWTGMSKFCTDFKDHPQVVRQIQKTKQKGPLAASVSEFFPACCAI